MLVVVDGEVAYGVGALLGDLTVAGGGAGVANGRPHTGQQLIGAKGLGEIVIGPQIQSGDLVLLVGAGGDHYHRQGGPAAELAQNVQTVHIRQAQIQNHQIRAVGGDHGHGLGSAGGPHSLVAIGGENGGDKAGDALFVLNDQNLFTDVHRVSSSDKSVEIAGSAGGMGRQKINSAPSG